MRLFIAEKPSLARAIAAALPGPQIKRANFIECGRDDVVAWCAGHILELVDPEEYDPQYRTWRLDHLPIVPTEWRLSPTAPELLRTIRLLLPRASRIVHAGDPDREGQLLVDEVLEYLGYRGPVDRLLISDLNLPAVRRAVADIRSNGSYRGLHEAALGRQRADWLFGMNLTRLYTILGRAGGYDGVLSVGRVQTPLLGLVVRRDIEIEQFQPRLYYVVRALVRTAEGAFGCTWQPPEDASPLIDENGRLLSRRHAVEVQAKVAQHVGAVTRCVRERKTEPAPLPYSLPDLQVDAGKRLGLGPKKTLDACQSLYETHRLLTYPRSDCSYLPEGQHDQATAVLAAIATNIPSLVPLIGKADRARRSRAWNDKKITAHHAIIPTLVAKPEADLSAAERGVYELVARRYVAQFYGPFEYHQTRVEVLVEGERFRASTRQVISDGWRAVIAPTPVDEDEKRSGDDDAVGALPPLQEGDLARCTEVTIEEKQTTPPKRFTDASLIQAMSGIARYVRDPKIKQLLRATDGIGTPATQASIIQTLFDRRFIEKRGRHVISTPIGRALIQSLPEIATQPDMTALWELAMRGIADGHMPLSQFLAGVVEQLRKLVLAGRSKGALTVPPSSPAASVQRRRRRRGARAGGRASDSASEWRAAHEPTSRQ